MNCLQLTNEGDRRHRQSHVEPITYSVDRPAKRRKRSKSGLRQIESLLFGVATAGVIWFAITCINQTISDVSSSPKSSTVAMTVAPGDTLWKIAGRLDVPNTEQTDVVNEIRSLNPSLSYNGSLATGQRILVPSTASNDGYQLHLAAAQSPVNNSM